MWNVISGAQLDWYLRTGKEMMLVDLRGETDYAKGHIRGAVNIPAETFPEQLWKLPRNRLIVLYCYHGPQSMRLARWLDQIGYDAEDVYGGVIAYRGSFWTEEIR